MIYFPKLFNAESLIRIFLRNYRSISLCSHLAVKLKFYIDIDYLSETIQYFAFIYVIVVNEMNISQLLN